MRIYLKYDKRIIDCVDNKYIIKISKKENNGIALDEETGMLKAYKSPDGKNGVDGKMNTPSNGIAGTPGDGIAIIRCNSSVTRIATEDPNEPDGGKSMIDIAKHILERDEI